MIKAIAVDMDGTFLDSNKNYDHSSYCYLKMFHPYQLRLLLSYLPLKVLFCIYVHYIYFKYAFKVTIHEIKKCLG